MIKFQPNVYSVDVMGDLEPGDLFHADLTDGRHVPLLKESDVLMKTGTSCVVLTGENAGFTYGSVIKDYRVFPIDGKLVADG